MADENSKDIATWLKEEGAIGLIVTIDKENGNIVKEIDKQLHISDNVVTKRLREARNEQNLIERTENIRKDQRPDRHVLTTRGEDLRELLEKAGIDDVYIAFRDAKRIIDDAPEELRPVIEASDLNKGDYVSEWYGEVHTDTIKEEPDDPGVDKTVSFDPDDYDPDEVETWGENEDAEK